MGNSGSSRKGSPVIAQCSAPVYCVKRIGPRHLLLGGGGGAAKTGVPNEIEAQLITFDALKNPTDSDLDRHLKVEKCGTVKTDPYATMCMDVVGTRPETGQFLVATGHDDYCDLYETTGFEVKMEGEGETKLGFRFREVARFIADEKDEGYMKCVRFDRSTSGKRMVSGGADGHIRVWDIKDITPNLKRAPLMAVQAHRGDVNDVDISQDGRTILSVGDDGKVLLTDIDTGKQLLELPTPQPIPKGYKVRTARYAPLGGTNLIFVTVYNEIQIKRKTTSFLALWAFNRERATCKPIVVRDACKESISSLALSTCGNFVGVGTMSGSVGIFDTHELKPLFWAQETHEIFVTDVEFLERRAGDVYMQGKEPQGALSAVPGPASIARAALVSLSADMKVQLHVLPFVSRPSPATFLLKTAIASLLGYYIIWSMSS